MLQHEPDRYTHLSEHDRSAPPEFELNYAEPAPQPDPTQLITGPLPPHPHSLQANGDHAGAAYLVGSDKSLDGMALMDLYEDATRPEENDDAIQDATLPCKTSATGGKSEGGNGSDAVKPPLPVADAPVVDPVEEDVVGSFTLDWRLPTPDASPVIERRGVHCLPLARESSATLREGRAAYAAGLAICHRILDHARASRASSRAFMRRTTPCCSVSQSMLLLSQCFYVLSHDVFQLME